MYCKKCGTQLPEDAVYCYKCGITVASSGRQAITVGIAGTAASSVAETEGKVLAPYDATSLKCPSCGAPISPKFGEMIITCEYCSSSVTLGTEGWKSIQKHTMLPLKVSDQKVLLPTIREAMNRGIFRWRVWERSSQEEMKLTYVPYWILAVSARTNVVAIDTAAQVGTVAASAAVIGAMSGGMGHRRGGAGIVEGALLGSMMTGGMGGGMKKSFQMNETHNYPVVALRALAEYQPHDFEFALQERTLFDSSKVPKGIKILNGDVGEDDARHQAKTLVDQLQSEKAHKQHHMIQQINTEIDVGEAELLHVPVWAATYDFKGKKIILIIDGNSGALIHSVGLDE